MEARRKIICDDIVEGFNVLRKDFNSGKLLQVDICQGGVIMTVHRIGADARIQCKELNQNIMYVNIDSYNIRLVCPLRFQWMDPGSDPYYQVIVWLTAGIEVIFYFWA